AEELVELTQLAALEMRRFGMTPKAALLSHSNFGASKSASARRMRQAVRLIKAASPDLLVDGEMHGDAALSQPVRDRLVLDSPL
ncbi:phosphate acyltransferase, partial [Klebsiella pneumoniae]|nr:phosphate acyltransferase [Klebsiella pneumoniae]